MDDIEAAESSNYVDVCAAEELPEKGFIVRSAGDFSIVLCRYQDQVYAVENQCSHALATFDEGRLRGPRLMCPLHGACFDIRDGKALGPPASRPIRSFRIVIQNDRVLIDLG